MVFTFREIQPCSDVHCSLDIIKALLLSSKAHLNIFSKNIVSILDTLLVDMTDLEIVHHCQHVFTAFCSAHDGSTLGVDTEFRNIYDRVMARFSDIAILTGDNSNRYCLLAFLSALSPSKSMDRKDTWKEKNHELML